MRGSLNDEMFRHDCPCLTWLPLMTRKSRTVLFRSIFVNAFEAQICSPRFQITMSAGVYSLERVTYAAQNQAAEEV